MNIPPHRQMAGLLYPGWEPDTVGRVTSKEVQNCEPAPLPRKGPNNKYLFRTEFVGLDKFQVLGTSHRMLHFKKGHTAPIPHQISPAKYRVCGIRSDSTDSLVPCTRLCRPSPKTFLLEKPLQEQRCVCWDDKPCWALESK